MNKVIIKMDYLHGPIWKEKYNPELKNWTTGIDLIDNDMAIQILNNRASEMYSNLYSFNNRDACVFYEDEFEKIKSSLLSIIETIILRLEYINDGSYIVLDETAKIFAD